jgi:hypothetical protein
LRGAKATKQSIKMQGLLKRAVIATFIILVQNDGKNPSLVSNVPNFYASVNFLLTFLR